MRVILVHPTVVNFTLPGLRSHALQPRAFSSLALSHPCTPPSSPGLARFSPGPRPVLARPRPASPGPRPVRFQAILPSKRAKEKLTSLHPKVHFPAAPVMGYKFLDPCASGGKGQECPQEIRTKQFMFMFLFLP